MNGKKWNDEEVEKLKYFYEIKGLACKEISEIIERPYFGIRKKIVVLGLKHTKEQEYKARSRSKSGENNPMYGKETWIKGKTTKSSKRLKKGGVKISEKIKNRYKNGFDTSGENNGMYGKIPWSKGLTKSTDIRLKNASEKISKKIKENWENLSEEEKERRRKSWALAGLKCKKKNTSIELKIENFLEKIILNLKNNIILEDLL